MRPEHEAMQAGLVGPLGDVAPNPDPLESALTRIVIARAALTPLVDNQAAFGPGPADYLDQINTVLDELYDAIESLVDDVAIVENVGVQEFVDNPNPHRGLPG